MENDPFVDDFPIKTSIYKGFSMAMLNNQMVCIDVWVVSYSILGILITWQSYWPVKTAPGWVVEGQVGSFAWQGAGLLTWSCWNMGKRWWKLLKSVEIIFSGFSCGMMFKTWNSDRTTILSQCFEHIFGNDPACRKGSRKEKRPLAPWTFLLEGFCFFFQARGIPNMIFQSKNAPGMVSGYRTSRERPVVLSIGIAAEERKGDVAGPEFAEIAGFFGMMLPSIFEVSKTKTMDFSRYCFLKIL